VSSAQSKFLRLLGVTAHSKRQALIDARPLYLQALTVMQQDVVAEAGEDGKTDFATLGIKVKAIQFMWDFFDTLEIPKTEEQATVRRPALSNNLSK